MATPLATVQQPTGPSSTRADSIGGWCEGVGAVAVAEVGRLLILKESKRSHVATQNFLGKEVRKLKKYEHGVVAL